MKLKDKKSNRHYKKIALIVIIGIFFSSQLLQSKLNLPFNFKLMRSQDDIINLSSNSNPLTGWSDAPSIFFINSSLGWCGGALPSITHPGYTPNYVILQSNDGGNNWDFQEENIPENMKVIIDKIQFINVSHGYAMSRYHPFILKTSNGGETWNYSNFTNWDGSQVYDMHFFNYSHGIISNRSGILITNDSGNTWSFKLNNLFLERFDFINSTYGFAINFNVTPNENGPLYYTNDSGYNWYLRNNTQFKCFDFINATHGWAVERYTFNASYKSDGDTHRIINTSDGGYTWDVQEIFQAPSSLFYISFTSENHVCITASNKIYITKDGGSSWTYTDAKTKWNFYAIRNQFFLDSNYGWIVSLEEHDLPDRWIYDPIHEYILLSYNILYHPVVILKTTDGGESWDEDEDCTLIESYHSESILLKVETGEDNAMTNTIILGVIGGSVAASTIIIVKRQQLISKKKKLNKISKEKRLLLNKRKKIATKPAPLEGYIGISDLSLEIKLKNLIKSQIPMESIKDERVLDFYKKEFNMLSEEEIFRISRLDIADFSEKILILDELASLSSEEREEFIKALENLE